MLFRSVNLISNASGAVVLEDGLIDGGVGDELRLALADAGHFVPVKNLGIAKEFLDHSARADILLRQGMDALAVIEATRAVRQNTKNLAALD